MNDFWIPKFKYQLVEWMERYYPKDKFGDKINWNSFTAKRLRAIYVNRRLRLMKTQYETRVTELSPREHQLELFNA